MSDRVSEDKKFEKKEHYLTPKGEYKLFNCTDPHTLIDYITEFILGEAEYNVGYTIKEVVNSEYIEWKITKKGEESE